MRGYVAMPAWKELGFVDSIEFETDALNKATLDMLCEKTTTDAVCKKGRQHYHHDL